MPDKPETRPHRPTYDAFIAAPMSSLGDAAYTLERGDVLAIMERLRTVHGLGSIYFAGAAISGREAFTNEVDALQEDLRALRDSCSFVLVYLSKIVTSALVEVGYALALRLPCLLLVRDKSDLPYLLNQAERNSASDLLPPLKIEIIHGPEQAAKAISAFYNEIVREVHSHGRR
jgi:hypothetical protein